MILIFYASVFLYTFALSNIYASVDNDLWARLIVGKTFFQTGSLLNYDFLSFGPTRQWIDHEWGSSLVFWAVLDKFGDLGLVLLKTIILFLVYFIITKIILLRRKERQNPFTSAPFNILFFIFLIQSSGEVAFAIRCQLFSFLFFAIWLYTLEKSRLEDNSRILWVLPSTIIIWSNMHGGCFTGLGLLGLYIAGEFLNKKPVKKYIIALIASLAVMFINPYGPDYVKFLFMAITMKRDNITEWQSLYSKIFLTRYLKFKIWSILMALFSGLYLCLKAHKIFKNNSCKTFKDKLINLYSNLDKTKALILIVMFVMSFKTLRLTPFFAFCAAAFLYDDFYRIFNKKLPNLINNLKEIFIFVFILISCFYTTVNFKSEMSLFEYPYKEAEFLQMNNLKGNLFADFHWGSYLAYKLWPDNYIFMDGRYEETYDPKLLNVLGTIFIGKRWKEMLDYAHFDYIITEKRYPLSEKLKEEKDWYSPYESNNFILFINKTIPPRDFKLPPEDIKFHNNHKWETKIDWK